MLYIQQLFSWFFFFVVVFFNSYFVRPAVLFLIREYEDSHFYDDLSVLHLIFFPQFMVNVRTGFPVEYP